MRKFFIFLLIAVILTVGLYNTRPVAAEGQNGTTLTAVTTIEMEWLQKYTWTLDKSVAPEVLHLFKGDSSDVNYIIKVTKTGPFNQYTIHGQVCVTNGGAVATENLAINVELTMPPSKDVIASTSVDISGKPVLQPGETGCYKYSIAMNAVTPGATYKATANVTITNHSGHMGEPFGPSPSASGDFPTAPTKILHDEINVEDSNGMTWKFVDSGEVSYSKTFTCDQDQGKHVNTAWIKEIEKVNDEAEVNVFCYSLGVTKTAETSFNRTWTWTVSKTGDQSSLKLMPGQSFVVNYTVAVDAVSADSDFAVAGKITITNPAPMPATLASVTDIISPDIAADVVCPSLEVPAATLVSMGSGIEAFTPGLLECTYSAALPDGATRTNTANATLINKPAGTTDFSGTAEVKFGDPTVIDACVTVSDDKYGSLGQVCAGQLPKTFSYMLTVGPYEACGLYQYINTASFVTNDTQASGSSSWTVDVDVPCQTGCTLTQGYWKTHSRVGPAPYDDGWKMVGPLEEQTPFYLSGKTWIGVFWTAPKGNPYYNLAHQYMAAKLNLLNGAASTPAVDTAIAWAENFFATTPPTATFNNSLKATINGYASILDNYNNGYIGPGHCSE